MNLLQQDDDDEAWTEQIGPAYRQRDVVELLFDIPVHIRPRLALMAALEEAEDAAAFDAAMNEEGANIPWEQVKADLGWE